MRAFLRCAYPMRRLLCWLHLLLLVAASGGSIAAESSDAAVRARLAQERQRIEAEFLQASRSCDRRFNVNGCKEQSLAQRRALLDVLRRQELELDAIQRQRRAADRREALRAKQHAAEERAANPPARDSAPEVAPIPTSASASVSASDSAASASHLAAPSARATPPPLVDKPRRAEPVPAATAAAAAGSAAGFATGPATQAAERVLAARRRAAEVAAAQLRVQQRQRDQEAKGKKSSPLPEQGASAASR